MSCPFQEYTGVYVLGAVTPEEHLRMGVHLKDCPSCQTEVAEFLAVLRILRALPPAYRPRACRALFIDWSQHN